MFQVKKTEQFFFFDKDFKEAVIIVGVALVIDIVIMSVLGGMIGFNLYGYLAI